jgi:hypothetical protein
MEGPRFCPGCWSEIKQLDNSRDSNTPISGEAPDGAGEHA